MLVRFNYTKSDLDFAFIPFAPLRFVSPSTKTLPSFLKNAMY